MWQAFGYIAAWPECSRSWVMWAMTRPPLRGSPRAERRRIDHSGAAEHLPVRSSSPSSRPWRWWAARCWRATCWPVVPLAIHLRYIDPMATRSRMALSCRPDLPRVRVALFFNPLPRILTEDNLALSLIIYSCTRMRSRSSSSVIRKRAC
mgnify:CR=1 FL=1